MHISSRQGLYTFLTILIFGVVTWFPARAAMNQRFFPETGHTVNGKFLDFYEQVSDPQLLYGYPITDAFPDTTSGFEVQYFQKARFELHPDESPDQQVQLSPLGSYLYKPGQPGFLPEKSSGCRTFQDVAGRFRVCMAFLNFFEAYGGIEQFGAPISNRVIEDGRIVQYFQKARFEWHPQLLARQHVQLSDLGSKYFVQQAINPNYLRQRNDLPQTILRIDLRLLPGQGVTRLKDRQTIYVVVQDQNLLPVANAQISLRFRLPNDVWKDLPLQAFTDKNGVARLELPFETTQPGMIILEATARLNDLQGQTTGSFLAWL